MFGALMTFQSGNEVEEMKASPIGTPDTEY